MDTLKLIGDIFLALSIVGLIGLLWWCALHGGIGDGNEEDGG
jgi:hypothetical protein